MPSDSKGVFMYRLALALVLAMTPAGLAFADGSHDHHSAPAQPSMEEKTSISWEGNTMTLTFGPVDLPTGHGGVRAASFPKHISQLPKDRYLTAFKSNIFTKDGKPLPGQYLHHI